MPLNKGSTANDVREYLRWRIKGEQRVVSKYGKRTQIYIAAFAVLRELQDILMMLDPDYRPGKELS